VIWKINYTEVAAKQMKKMDKSVSKCIDDYLHSRVAKRTDPTSLGKALTNDKRGIWRYRVGDYRILCEIKNHELIVLVLRIGHRKQVYDE
jgi:mRNA interferase RelE/StbE